MAGSVVSIIIVDDNLLNLLHSFSSEQRLIINKCAFHPDLVKSVSVIVPIYNGVREGLRDCLISICDQTYPEIELIGVDDNSSDSSGEIVNQILNRVTGKYILHQENRGLAATLNDGIRNAKGDYLIFMQQDCRFVDIDSIKNGVEYLESHPESAVLVGRQMYDLSKLNFYQILMEFRLSHIFLNGELNGPIALTENKCDLVRSSDMEKVGPFDESLKLSGEDQVFSSRVRELGMRIEISDRMKYENSLAGEGSLKGVIGKEARYGKYSVPLAKKMYRTTKERRTSDRYLKEKMSNRRLSLAFALVCTLSPIVYFFALKLGAYAMIGGAVIGRATDIILRLDRVKDATMEKKLNVPYTILATFLLDFVYSISLAYWYLVTLIWKK